jgi:hypothetical protein
MVEFAHCVKQFKGWKGQEKRRMRLLGDLLEIIRRNVYRKFGAVVVNTTFKENLSDKAKEKFFLNAYSLVLLRYVKVDGFVCELCCHNTRTLRSR